MGALSLPVISLFLMGASSFRVKPKRKTKGTQPAIAGIFPYASPATAQPPLKNPLGGTCFPGVRTATVKMQWFGQEADTATTILGVIGFRHPFMDFKLLDLKDSKRNTLYPCLTGDAPNRPRGLSKIELHNKDFYANATQDMDLGWGSLLYDLAKIGIPESFNLDRNSAHANAQQYGWNLIGSAVDNGGSGYVGKQVSHLFQKPSTKECMLTFQGSSSFQDWTANVNIQKKPFCGYAKASAFIAEDDTTSVLGEGESLVHKGFADALMQIVKNSDWQSDVRAKFPSCSKVYVTGHSLGAAQAELFGACINMAPQPGQDGYEEYRHMSWTV